MKVNKVSAAFTVHTTVAANTATILEKQIKEIRILMIKFILKLMKLQSSPCEFPIKLSQRMTNQKIVKVKKRKSLGHMKGKEKL